MDDWTWPNMAKFTMLTFVILNFSVMFTYFGHIHSVKWITLIIISF